MNRLLACLRRSTDSSLTDRHLLDRFLASRDEAAFAAIVRRHGPLVWGVCRRNLPNPADAEDAFQATFLVLVRRSAWLPQHDSLGPWLYRVAVWCCRNVRRSNRRRLKRVRPGLAEPAAVVEAGIDADLSAALDRAVLSLPEKYRTPIVLCHLQGWSRRQAAAHLGCPEGTLSAQLSRALAKLRAKLAVRDPAVVLAVAGAVAAPSAVTAAAIRAAVIDTTGVGAISPTVLSTAERALTVFWSKSVRYMAGGVLAITCVFTLSTGLTARQSPNPESQSADKAAPVSKPVERPVLAPGNWTVVEWLAPNHPRQVAVLTVTAQDGKPVVTAVQGDTFQWKASDLTVSGPRVRLTMTRDGPLTYRFDGLFDPADPTRVLGSLGHGSTIADRVVLELVRPGRPAKPQRPVVPPAYLKWVEQEQALAMAQSDFDRQAKERPATQKDDARRILDAAQKTYAVETPKVLRQLVAERAADAFGFEAVHQLFFKLDTLKPPATEVDTWAKVARSFAATHGPQFESATLGRIANRLIRHIDYAPLARTLAAEADKLAAEAGLPPAHVKLIAAHDEERAAWATQSNPPAAGTTWTVTVTGKVTDAQGSPIADATVLVNNTQWVKTLTEDGSYQTKTGPDGRYLITLKCQGTNRLHVTCIWAEKRGFVRSENRQRHKLLPGQSTSIDFTLKPGEPFGGILKLRKGDPSETHVLTVKGPGVEEVVVVKNGEKVDLTLPAGTYTAELMRGRKTLTWSGLKTGTTDHVFDEPAFQFTPETVGAGFDELWKAMDRNYSYFFLKPDVDWAKLRDEYRPRAIRARSAEELSVVLKEMLGRLKDGHVWIITPDGKQVGTYQSTSPYNGNAKVTFGQMTDVTECGRFANVGKTRPDGFG
jgi:RNA polymerase sigma factor (sigma-70 family)